MARPNKTGINWQVKGEYARYMREYNAAKRPEIKAMIHELLGGSCQHCGVNDERILDIDHVDRMIGTSAESKKRGSLNYLTKILREIESGDHNYRLLCRNCNWIAYLESKNKVKVF